MTAKKPQMRFFNVTLVDFNGSPSTTQIYADNDTPAMSYIVERIKKGQETWNSDSPMKVWYKPIVYAFVFDTLHATRWDYKVTFEGNVVPQNF